MLKHLSTVAIFFAALQANSQTGLKTNSKIKAAPAIAAASADATTAANPPAPPPPTKTPVDRVGVESTFQSFYLAHLTLNTIKATAKAKGHSDAEIAKLTPQVYWKVIDEWVKWFNNSDTSAEDLLEVRTLFNSPDGKKYKKVFDPQILPTAYNQQILNGVSQLPADAPEVEDIKAVAKNMSLANRLLVLVSDALKKNSRPTSDRDIATGYNHLCQALAIALHKEGFTKTSFKSFRNKIEQPGTNRFFFSIHQRIKDKGFELITSQVPAKK